MKSSPGTRRFQRAGLDGKSIGGARGALGAGW